MHVNGHDWKAFVPIINGNDDDDDDDDDGNDGYCNNTANNSVKNWY